MASSSTPAGAQSSSDEDSSIMAPIVPARLMTYITADLMIKINFNDSYRHVCRSYPCILCVFFCPPPSPPFFWSPPMQLCDCDGVQK